ncbi:MAG: YggT family protein [Candidatus Nitrotoga sp.]
MLSGALQFLLDTLLQPFAVILLLRFHLQWLHAPMRNPLGEFIMTLTNFLVLRTRRFIPSAKGFDIATLLLAFVVEAVYLAATLWLQPLSIDFSVFGLIIWTAFKLFKLSIYLLMAALFIQALLSWFNPRSTMAGLMAAVTQPFLLPLQRRIPPFGNIDLTLLILLIVCQLIIIVPLRFMESSVSSPF